MSDREYRLPASLCQVPDSRLHKDVPAHHIAHVFRIMRQASQHEFQLLTKRPDIAAKMLNDPDFQKDTVVAGCTNVGWPVPNVWLGTSVEDQPRANERIPHLQNTPAVVRFLSVEPMLGPVCPDLFGIGSVICGGESGPSARPMNARWARSLRDQCAAANVPFFFKQWGEFAPDDPAPDAHTAMRRVGKKAAGAMLDGREWRQFPQSAAASALRPPRPALPAHVR